QSSSRSATSPARRSPRLLMNIPSGALYVGIDRKRRTGSSWRGGVQLARQQLERLAVAVGALAEDLGQDETVEDRELAPLVAPLDVGEVDLDRGHAGDVEGIGDRPAVVGPGAGIDDGRVGELGHAVQVFAVLALGVGLEEDRFEAELARPGGDLRLQLEQ